MNYMPIVPIGLLDVLKMSGVKDHFILSQFWDNPEYRNFYTSGLWDTVVIDNGLYEDEDAQDIKHLINIATSINAQKTFIVGPENLKDGIDTGRMTQEIINEYHGCVRPKWRLMCILHENPDEMRVQYEMLKDYKDLAFGISIFSFRLGWDRASLYKFVGIEENRYVHAFGFDNLLEALNMHTCPGFKSVDSSMAVTAAINNIDLYKAWQITRQPGRGGVLASTRADILDREFSQEIKNKVLANIMFLRKWCKRPFQPSWNTTASTTNTYNLRWNPEANSYDITF